MKQERFPIYYSGSAKAFEFLADTRIEGTLLLPQPFVMSFQPEFLNVSQRCFLEPLLTIIIVNEDFKDTIVKNGFKTTFDNTIYIYFPFEVRVDEILYKKGSSSYDALLKEVPRSQRDYFAKLVICEQGKGDHSPQSHVSRISALISRELKISIEKRIASLNEQTTKAQTQPLTFGKIARLHTLKLNLIKIYQHLRMHSLMTPILMEEYQYICLNKFYFKNVPVSDARKLTYNPTMINVQLVIELLRSQDINLLEFMTHCFYQIFTHLAKTLRITEALNFLREFLSFVKTNVLEASQDVTEKVLQNVWTIQLVESALAIVQIHKNLLTQARRAQIDVLQASLKLYVKDVLEEAGYALYGFNQSLFHCLNIDLQLDMLMGFIRSHPPRPERETYSKQLQEGKQKQKVEDIVNAQLKRTLSSYADFIECYIRYLQQAMMLMKETRLRRVLLHLGITLLRAKVQFPWLKIEANFEQFQLETTLDSWDGLLLLRSIYLFLYYRSIDNKPLQDREISFILSSKMLTSSHRATLIQLISEEAKHTELVACRFGEIDEFSVAELGESQYRISLRFHLEVACSLLFDRIQVHLSDPNDSTRTLQLQYGKQDISEGGNNTLLASTEIKVQQRLTQKISRIDAYSGRIHFLLALSNKISESLFEFNGASIYGRWQYDPHTLYLNMLTPYLLRIKCMPSCQTVNLSYPPSKDYTLSKYTFKDSTISSSGCEQIKIDAKQCEGSINVQLLLAVSKADPTRRELPLKIELTFEGNVAQTLTHLIRFSSANSLTVAYQAGDRLFQYGVTNILRFPIHILAKNRAYKLQESEEVTTRCQDVLIGLSDASMTSLSLRSIAPNWHAVASDKERFKLRLLGLPLRLLQQANIQSDNIGVLHTVPHQGYQLIGKVKGLQRYRSGKCLQLSIIPTRRGKIVLPDIYIEGKKGEWNTPVVLDVE